MSVQNWFRFSHNVIDLKCSKFKIVFTKLIFTSSLIFHEKCRWHEELINFLPRSLHFGPSISIVIESDLFRIVFLFFVTFSIFLSPTPSGFFFVLHFQLSSLFVAYLTFCFCAVLRNSLSILLLLLQNCLMFSSHVFSYLLNI